MYDQIERQATRIADKIRSLEYDQKRIMIAIAGPPGAGKSTLADAVVAALGPLAVLMPMDGFHLDNRILEARGLVHRKGAPETFDMGGLAASLGRISAGEQVYLPLFDRSREIAIAGAGEITSETRFVVVEGNYLCLDEAPWHALAAFWDLTVFLQVPMPELERRLVARWRSYGYDDIEARNKAMSNDIPNAQRVCAHRSPVDVVIFEEDEA